MIRFNHKSFIYNNISERD